MREYESNILRGSIIEGTQLRLPRAQAIYRAANAYDYAEVIQCRRNYDYDEIITIKLTRLQIPENPIYDIHTEESVAVICKTDDESWPEVYAIRKDFPLGLSHSNPKPYKRPVSMCVIDFHFVDVRLQFSAYEYINDIRMWLEKNSVGELHELDRPLEILLSADRVCALIRETHKVIHEAVYEKTTAKTSILKFTENESPTHYVIAFVMEPVISSGIAYAPENLGELSELVQAINNETIPDGIVRSCQNVKAEGAKFPLLILLSAQQKRTFSDKTEEELYLVSTNISAHDVNHNKSRFTSEHFNKWLREVKIEIDGVILPSSRVVNRIANSTTVTIPHVTFIGTGTLGSNVIDHLWRKGVSEKIIVVDYDSYMPHNYSRHVLPARSVQRNKAQAMHDWYEGVDGQQMVSIPKDVLKLSKHEKEEIIERANLIIDASTIIAVERHLARDVESSLCRCCTIFLSPNGYDMVLLMEDKLRQNRLDLLEMDYYRQLIENNEISDHLSLPDTLRINTFSCRETSSKIDYDNVGVLASIASREIQCNYQHEQERAEIWRIDKTKGEVSHVDIPVDEWEVYKRDHVTIYVSKPLLKMMNEERERWGKRETGGCLCGCYDKDRNIIYVFSHIPAPEDSIHETNSFVRGKKGLTEAKNKIAKRTFFQVHYLGEWHSHPRGDSSPSFLDKKQFAEMNEELLQHDVPFVQMICSPKGFYVNGRM